MTKLDNVPKVMNNEPEVITQEYPINHWGKSSNIDQISHNRQTAVQ